MIFAIEGKIEYIGKDYIVVNVNHVFYQVFVPRVEEFKLNESSLIFTYQVVREDEQYLAGFKSKEEKEAFLSLISVKGIGPRTALGALSKTTSEDLRKAISANNVLYLKKLPGIGAKAAAQIILDLKGQLTEGEKGNPQQYEEVRNGLKNLGFKNKEIDNVLENINEPNVTNEEILRIALKKLRK